MLADIRASSGLCHYVARPMIWVALLALVMVLKRPVARLRSVNGQGRNYLTFLRSIGSTKCRQISSAFSEFSSVFMKFMVEYGGPEKGLSHCRAAGRPYICTLVGWPISPLIYNLINGIYSHLLLFCKCILQLLNLFHGVNSFFRCVE